MSGKTVFLDTNIVIYAYSKTDVLKQKSAREAIIANNCLVSTQVLNEFCNIGFKKLNLSASEIRADIEDLLEKCECAAVSPDTVLKALSLHEEHQFPFYDALIVASAIQHQCDFLFSEDMQDGQIIEGVTIQDIFSNSGENTGRSFSS